MAIPKFIFFPLILIVLFQSCLFVDDTFDKDAAIAKINLDQRDIQNFNALKTRLIRDLPMIKKVMQGISQQGKWIATNTYYLNQVDSVSYSKILSKLNGKYYDDLFISDSGQVIFILKNYVQRKSNDYNNTYQHQLVSAECNCPNVATSDNGDTVYVDSLINPDWKYVVRKYYSGH